MGKNHQDNQPNEETSIQTAKEFLAKKQYDELLTWVNDLLENGEKDWLYRIRAIATVYGSYKYPGDESEFLTAFDDIEKALELSYSESNLRIKHWILGSAIDYYHNSGLFLPLFEYTVDHTQDRLLVRDSSLDGKDYISKLPYGVYITDHKENYRARLHVLNELIQLTGKPEYYEQRAVDHKKQNDLLLALEDISKSIELEPTAQRYMLKAEIEIASNLLENALLSSDQAYDHGASQEECLDRKLSIYKRLSRYSDALTVLDQLLTLDVLSEKNLNDKFLLLYDLKRYPEALIVLDDMIALSPPQSVNPDDFIAPQISNSYARKLDVMLRMEDYDAYSSLIKSFLAQKLDLSLIYYLSSLIKKHQYNVILNHFQNEQNNYPVIKWFLICAYIGLDDKVNASHLIRQINCEEVFIATSGYYNIWNRNQLLEVDQLHRDDSIASLFESLNLKKMSFLLFLELILALTNNHLKIKSQYADQGGAANDDAPAEIDHAIVALGDTDFVDSRDSLGEYSYDESAFRNLPDINSIISEMKSEPSYIDGTDKFTPELHAKQKLLKGLDQWEKFPTCVEEMLWGIERELTKILDIQSIHKINKAKEEERNRILANLSHSIKNMLKAVIDPLMNLRDEIPQKAVIIDNAIKGANLIREIVNAINLSFKTTLEELKWDVLNQGKESMTLQDMVVDSLRYSVSNMFDSRYFPAFSENYFPRSVAKKQYEQIKSQWNDVSAGDVRLIKDFLDQHMFRLELNLDESRDYHVGNEKSSAIKLLILFQEIIFNAVKYASYVSHTDRQVVIMLASHGDNLTLTVRNSFNPKVQAKTTGVGKVVIENFARVLGCEPMISTDSNTYSISLEFKNIWRNNAENFVH